MQRLRRRLWQRRLTHPPDPSLSQGKGWHCEVLQIGCREEEEERRGGVGGLVIIWMHLSGLVYLLGSEMCPLCPCFSTFLQGTNREVSSRHLSDDCSAELSACPLLLTSHSPDWTESVWTRCSFILQSVALHVSNRHVRAHAFTHALWSGKF